MKITYTASSDHSQYYAHWELVPNVQFSCSSALLNEKTFSEKVEFLVKNIEQHPEYFTFFKEQVARRCIQEIIFTEHKSVDSFASYMPLLGVISLTTNHGLKDILYFLVFESCNSERRFQAPLASDFKNAEDYADACEKYEYSTVIKANHFFNEGLSKHGWLNINADIHETKESFEAHLTKQKTMRSAQCHGFTHHGTYVYGYLETQSIGNKFKIFGLTLLNALSFGCAQIIKNRLKAYQEIQKDLDNRRLKMKKEADDFLAGDDNTQPLIAQVNKLINLYEESQSEESLSRETHKKIDKNFKEIKTLSLNAATCKASKLKPLIEEVESIIAGDGKGKKLK